MSQRLSPKKSWEGYLAGIVFATLGTAGLALLWQYLAGVWPESLESAALITPLSGALLGLIVSVLTHPGRPGREHDQAPGRCKGLREFAARPWRRL